MSRCTVGRVISHGLMNTAGSGLLDPWSSGGVTPDKLPEGAQKSVQPVVIKEGAHHLDLMFSHPDDPPSVITARRTEVEAIRSWTNEGYARRAKRTSGGA